MQFRYNVDVNFECLVSLKAYLITLKSIGYTPFSDNTDDGNINFLKVRSYSTGQYNTLPLSAGQERFSFSGNGIENVEAALAIASIRKDEGFHTGEWVVFDSESYNGQFTKGKLYQIDQRDYKKGHFYVLHDDQGEGNGFGANSSKKFHKATTDEILAFFNPNKKEVKKEGRKIVGYRLLKDTPTANAGMELREEKLVNGKPYFLTDVVIPITGERTKKGYNKLILEQRTDWFEPIYEEEEMSIDLILGSNRVTIRVTSKGKIVAKGQNFYIDRIKELHDYYTKPNMISLNTEGWTGYVNKDVKFIRIGCMVENHLFSLADLDVVIKTYNDLNP